MGMLVASAALAKTGGLGFIRLSAAGDVTSSCPSPTPSPSPSESPSPDQGTSDEQESDDQSTTDEQESDDQGTSDEQESTECKDSKKDTKKKTGGNAADREKACKDAASMSTDSTAAGTAGTTQVKTTGLDHAIEMVLANCIKNPQAPGLLNALRHLVANRERHAAHDEEKAARKAAHDAAKASKGHGH